MSIATSPVLAPYSAPWRTSEATFALQSSFLLGMQFTLGHEPPIQRRSTTAVRLPAPAMCHARSLPPAPLPRMRISNRSACDITSSGELGRLLPRTPFAGARLHHHLHHPLSEFRIQIDAA